MMNYSLNNNISIRKLDTSEQNVFFTSDTHFWHSNIIKFCNRPFSSVAEMNDTIIDNWNSVVKENDIVFHLGDFGFCGSQQLKRIFERLNGNIHLVIGNHDWKMLKDGSSQHFASISQQLSIIVNDQSIYLNHYPFLCYAGTYRSKSQRVWQLFGHVHTSPLSDKGLDNERMTNLFPTQYDVGVDNNNFTPVSFEQVKTIIENQIMSTNKA